MEGLSVLWTRDDWHDYALLAELGLADPD